MEILKTKKILNNFIYSENIFNNNKKDFLDEELEFELKNDKEIINSNICNPNNSQLNNISLSYSVSSFDNSNISKFKFYLNKFFKNR